MKMSVNLDNGIELRSVPDEVFESLTGKYANEIFDNDQYFFRPRSFYSDEEKSKIAVLKQNLGNPQRINLIAFDNEAVVGWSWGIQESSEVFYMVNSAVLPAYRRKGIYGALTSTIVEEAANLGFQVVYSKHIATNNAVLIPKLKAGFMITSFEVSDQYGVLVHLKWYKNSARRKMAEFRSGGIGFDKELRKILKL